MRWSRNDVRDFDLKAIVMEPPSDMSALCSINQTAPSIEVQPTYDEAVASCDKDAAGFLQHDSCSAVRGSFELGQGVGVRPYLRTYLSTHTQMSGQTEWQHLTIFRIGGP